MKTFDQIISTLRNTNPTLAAEIEEAKNAQSLTEAARLQAAHEELEAAKTAHAATAAEFEAFKAATLEASRLAAELKSRAFDPDDDLTPEQALEETAKFGQSLIEKADEEEARAAAQRELDAIEARKIEILAKLQPR